MEEHLKREEVGDFDLRVELLGGAQLAQTGHFHRVVGGRDGSLLRAGAHAGLVCGKLVGRWRTVVLAGSFEFDSGVRLGGRVPFRLEKSRACVSLARAELNEASHSR